MEVRADLTCLSGGPSLGRYFEAFGEYSLFRLCFPDGDIRVDSCVPAQILNFAKQNPEKTIEVHGECSSLRTNFSLTGIMLAIRKPDEKVQENDWKVGNIKLPPYYWQSFDFKRA